MGQNSEDSDSLNKFILSWLTMALRNYPMARGEIKRTRKGYELIAESNDKIVIQDIQHFNSISISDINCVYE